MSNLTLPEKVMLNSAAAWELTFCEPTKGLPGEYTLVWRAEKYHGKIGSVIKSKAKPTKARVTKELQRELLSRFQSPRRCDAKRVAYLWLSENSKPLPMGTKQTFKMIEDALYDLDNKIGSEFWSNEPPKLFMGVSHGWILAEIAEIRCLVSSLTQAVQKAEGR